MKKIHNYIRRNKNIILQFIKRETISRYKGSYLGFLWTILTPILMLLVYTFVFSEIFQAKWGSGSGNKLEFAIIVFCGLTTFNIFSEVIARSPSLVINNANYVKKVVFPLEVFPLIAVGTALVNASINYALLIVFYLIFMQSISWTILLLPLALVPMVIFSVGLSWFLSSLGVYLRDIGHVIGIAVQALMLLSPILYPIDVIPDEFQWFYQINPITYFVEDIRKVLVWGEVPDLGVYVVQLMAALIIFIAGLVWFRKTKHGFADVL